MACIILLTQVSAASDSLMIENIVQLTDDPWNQGEPAWGQDRIAYISNNDLWIMNADGSDKTPIYSPSSREREPAWSQDDTKIIFSSDQTSDTATRYYNILEIDVNSRDTTLLMGQPIHQRSPSWAPDGRILFLMWSAGNYDIWICDPDGGNPQQRTSTSGDENAPTLSPDGEQIAFSFEGDIWVMSADSKNPLMITNDEYVQENPTWSPNGKWIAYDSNEEGEFDIWAHNLDEGERIRLTGSEGIERNPSWSPDGKWIAYESSAGATTNIKAMRINMIGETEIPTPSPTQNASQTAQTEQPQQPEPSEPPQQSSTNEKILGIIPVPQSIKSKHILAVVLVISLVYWRQQKLRDKVRRKQKLRKQLQSKKPM